MFLFILSLLLTAQHTHACFIVEELCMRVKIYKMTDLIQLIWFYFIFCCCSFVANSELLILGSISLLLFRILLH